MRTRVVTSVVRPKFPPRNDESKMRTLELLGTNPTGGWRCTGAACLLLVSLASSVGHATLLATSMITEVNDSVSVPQSTPTLPSSEINDGFQQVSSITAYPILPPSELPPDMDLGHKAAVSELQKATRRACNALPLTGKIDPGSGLVCGHPVNF